MVSWQENFCNFARSFQKSTKLHWNSGKVSKHSKAVPEFFEFARKPQMKMKLDENSKEKREPLCFSQNEIDVSF